MGFFSPFVALSLNSLTPSRFKSDVSVVNVDKIQLYIDMGRLKISTDGSPITMRELLRSGVVSSVKEGGVKLLGGGSSSGAVKDAINVEVARASKSAIEAIESVGGSVTCVYHNRVALRAHLKPECFPTVMPKHARPPPQLMPYYLDYENRGYLSPQLQLRKQLEKLHLKEEDLVVEK